MKTCCALVFLAFFLLPSSAIAGICDFDKKFITKNLQEKSKVIENLSGPVDRQRNAEAAPIMKKKDVRQMLKASWMSFGYKKKALKKRINLNMKQINNDSNYRPHLTGYFAGEVGIPSYTDSEGNVSGGSRGGLFAVNEDVYREWKDFYGWRGNKSRLNPLSNIVAGVAAQVANNKIFRGKGRINIRKKNGSVCTAKK
jgi:hypothetical protein